jgi:probable rRNA maturation factor
MPTDQSDSNPPPEPEPRCTSAVSLCDQTQRLAPAALAWLEEKATRAIATLKTPGELSIRIVSDDEMAKAHDAHKGVPGTTDVLTFDLSDNNHTLDVDLLVCLDEAIRQSAARNHTPEQELLLYIVHGLLHCTGHNDHDEQHAQIMHEAEDTILTTIGVDATYARPTVQGEGR